MEQHEVVDCGPTDPAVTAMQFCELSHPQPYALEGHAPEVPRIRVKRLIEWDLDPDHSAWPQYAVQFRNRSLGVAHVFQNRIADDNVKRAIRKLKIMNIVVEINSRGGVEQVNAHPGAPKFGLSSNPNLQAMFISRKVNQIPKQLVSLAREVWHPVQSPSTTINVQIPHCRKEPND